MHKHERRNCHQRLWQRSDHTPNSRGSLGHLTRKQHNRHCQPLGYIMNRQTSRNKDSEIMSVLPSKANSNPHPLRKGMQRHYKYDQQNLFCICSAQTTHFDIFIFLQKALRSKNKEQPQHTPNSRSYRTTQRTLIPLVMERAPLHKQGVTSRHHHPRRNGIGNTNPILLHFSHKTEGDNAKSGGNGGDPSVVEDSVYGWF
mmetsp:Transcript_10804/g.23749  ORF Transcript_10804/g.23749 Transcript_10804/m.23749 type:complete len:200 (-) Transcript_10804:677-1276(-)